MALRRLLCVLLLLFLQLPGSAELGDRLEQAIREGNLPLVKRIMQGGMDPETPLNGSRPLELAVAHRQLEVVRYLLSVGANPNGELRSVTPLWRAGVVRYWPVTELLLDAGANPEFGVKELLDGWSLDKPFPILQGGDDEYTKRYLAATRPSPELLGLAALYNDYFLELFLQQNLPKDWAPGPALLRQACHQHRITMVNFLLSKGVAQEPDEDGFTPLMFAVCEYSEHNAIPVVKSLLRAGADPNKRVLRSCSKSGGYYQKGSRALELAKNTQTALLLVQSGTSLDCQLDAAKRGPLHLARNSSSLLTEMLSRGADPDALDILGQTFLFGRHYFKISVLEAHPELKTDTISWDGRTLWMQGEVEAKWVKNPDYQDSDGQTALSWQVANLSQEAAFELLKAGADPNRTCSRGFGPLNLAKDGLTISRLLKAGADPNLGDGTVGTILHQFPNDFNLVQELLAAGAKIDATDRFGNTALMRLCEGPQLQARRYHWAQKQLDLKPSHEEPQEEFIFNKELDTDFDFDTNPYDPLDPENDLKEPLKSVERLLKAGADVNRHGSLGRTPLHLAAASGYTETCKLLIEKGAQLNVEDVLGQTPLDLARKSLQVDLIDHLEKLGGHSTRVPSLVRVSPDPGLRARALFHRSQPSLAAYREAWQRAWDWGLPKSFSQLGLEYARELQRNGRNDEARKVLQRSLQTTRPFESEGPKIILALADLADKPEPYLKRALAMSPSGPERIQALQALEKHWAESSPGRAAGVRHLWESSPYVSGFLALEAFSLKGQPKKAAQLQRRALQLAGRGSEAEAKLLRLFGRGYLQEGRYREAHQAFSEYQKLAIRFPSKASLIVAEVYLGLCASHSGAFDEALKHYRAANEALNDEKLDAKEGSLRRRYLAIGGSANVLAELGQYDLSEQYVLKALEVAKESLLKDQDYNSLQTLLDMQAATAARAGQHEEALEGYQSVLSSAVEGGIREGIFLHHVAKELLELKQYSLAKQHLELAISILEARDSLAIASDCLVTLGRLGLATGDLSKARQNLTTALRSFETLESPHGQVSAYQVLAESVREESPERALQYLDRAIEVLEDDLAHGLDSETRATYLGLYRSLYEDRIDLLFQLNRISEALQVSERARASTLIDLMGELRFSLRRGAPPALLTEERLLRQELEELARQPRSKERRQSLRQVKQRLRDLMEQIRRQSPALAQLKTVERPSVSEVQAQLDNDTVILSFFVGQKKVYLWAITADRVAGEKLELSPLQLRRAIGGVARAVRRPQALSAAHLKLGEFLLAPIQEQLKNKNKLVVVPSRELHYLPFGVLQMSDVHLQQEVALSYSTSLSAWLMAQSLESKGERVGVAALGSTAPLVEGTRSGFESLGALQPLPGTRAEALALKQLYPDSSILLEDAMTARALKQMAAEARLLHVATHGVLDSAFPLLSGLVTSDGMVTVSDLFDWEVPADLVVLSACETGLGSLGNGGELIGLTRALQYAGAKSVLASLWPISDQVTILWMEHFHGSLSQGASRAEAARRAAVAVRKKYPEPYYWAPFVLYGVGHR